MSICFLHIPKAGGSAVIAFLRAMLGDAVFHANGGSYQRAPVPFLLGRHPVVAGHFTVAQIPDRVLETAFVFTFLRDPVDRAVSLYHFYRDQPDVDGQDGRVSRTRTLDFARFVDQLPARIGPWSNWQTFVLSGALDAERPATELLPSALRNLERLAFVGLQDELDDGLRHLCACRGWPPPASALRVNATRQRPPLAEVDPAVIARLTELNACDAELVARARELWAVHKRNRPPVQRPIDHPEQAFGHPSPRLESGTRDIMFTLVEVLPRMAGRSNIIEAHDRALVRLRGYSRITANDVTVGIRVSDTLGVELYGTNTRLLGLSVALDAGQTFEVIFAVDMTLAPGRYRLTAAIHSGDDHLEGCYHWIENAAEFECVGRGATRYSGLVDLHATAHLTTD